MHLSKTTSFRSKTVFGIYVFFCGHKKTLQLQPNYTKIYFSFFCYLEKKSFLIDFCVLNTNSAFKIFQHIRIFRKSDLVQIPKIWTTLREYILHFSSVL